MAQYQSFAIGKQGELTMAGVSLVEMAKTYGTPLYLLDEQQVRENCRGYQRAMAKHFGQDYHVAYASKALCIKALYPILSQEGMVADVVSGGELYTAIAAGFDPGKLHFHGNNKSPQE